MDYAAIRIMFATYPPSSAPKRGLCHELCTKAYFYVARRVLEWYSRFGLESMSPGAAKAVSTLPPQVDRAEGPQDKQEYESKLTVLKTFERLAFEFEKEHFHRLCKLAA